MGEGSYLHNLRRKRKQKECEECEEVIAPETSAGSPPPPGAGGGAQSFLVNKDFLGKGEKKKREREKEKNKRQAEQKQGMSPKDGSFLEGGERFCSRQSSTFQGAVGSPSVVVFQNHGDTALRDAVMGMVGWVGAGHGDLSRLFQP